MKQIASNYSFDASERKVTVQGLTIPLERLLLIVNATRNQIIYNLTGTGHPTQPLGATASTAGGNSVFTLAFDTTGFLDSDKLSIFYDDGTSGGNTIDGGNLTITGIESEVEIKNDEGNPVPMVVPQNYRLPVDLPATTPLNVVAKHSANTGDSNPPTHAVQIGVQDMAEDEFRPVTTGNPLPVTVTNGISISQGNDNPVPVTGSVVANVTFPNSQDVVVKNSHLSPVLVASPSGSPLAIFGSDVQIGESYGNRTHSGATATTPFTIDAKYPWVAVKVTNASATTSSYRAHAEWGSDLGFTDEFNENEHFIEGMVYDTFARAILAPKISTDGKWMFIRRRANYLRFRGLDATGTNEYEVFGANILARPLPSVVDIKSTPTLSTRIVDGMATMTAITVKDANIATNNFDTSLVVGLNPTSNTVRVQDGSGNGLTSSSRGTQRALSVQIVDASGNQVTSFGGGGGAVTQSGNWSVRAQDGAGNALTSAARGSERALSVQIIDGSGNQITTFGAGSSTTYATITRNERINLGNIANSSTTILGANPSRKYLLVQNVDASATAYISFVGAPSVNSLQIPPRSSLVFEGTFIPTNVVMGGSSNAAGSSIIVVEG
jgi:hypothetical protein